MSDSTADTGDSHLAPEGLPPPAHVVGGVRHAAPTRPAHVDHPAKHVASPVSHVVTALDPQTNVEQQLQAATASAPPVMSVRDAAEQPKANPATYFPPPYTHTNHHDHNTRGHIKTSGMDKQIQQHTGSHGR